MNYYSSNSFNQLYFNLLENAFYSTKQLQDSRTGRVKDLGRTVYQIKNDSFRLCFLKERDLNPFFAFAEFSWIIEGSNKLDSLEYFISIYNQFSDDGHTLNGAYGFRLKEHFKIDQIQQAINILKNDDITRRVVLTMYSPEDLLSDSKDIPCNTTIYLKIRNAKLDITILNRSNDLFLGVPYNVFVFYLLQVYISKAVNCGIGTQTHYTDSLHLYEKHFDKVKQIIKNNSINGIIELEKRYKFSNNSYISINHKDVINKEFYNMDQSQYKQMFILFDQFKKDSKINYDNIPKNLMGYCMYNWLSNRKNINKEEIEYFKDEGKKMTDAQILGTVKYKKVEETIEILHNLKNIYLSNFDDFKKVTMDSTNNNSIIQLNIENKEKFINIMLLVVVIESLSSNMYDRELREELMNKIKKVCQVLEINLNDVFHFSKYEDEIIKIFN